MVIFQIAVATGWSYEEISNFPLSDLMIFAEFAKQYHSPPDLKKMPQSKQSKINVKPKSPPRAINNAKNPRFTNKIWRSR